MAEGLDSQYVLATGDEAERRLELVQDVHGADTERLLERAGIAPGHRALDVGCGIGVVTCWMAERVTPGGEAIGVDRSADQIGVAARRAAERGLGNARFIAAPASETGLERGAFDVAFCRFLLMHVPTPETIRAEMAALLRPGGVLVVEDGDFEAPYCSPRSPAFDRCFELYRAGVALTGADPVIGTRLANLVMGAGFRHCDVSIVQPVLRHGEAKRLPEWTLLEARDNLVAAGLTTTDEVDAIATQLRVLAADPTARFGMAMMTQVRAVKGPA
jgi:ubiquinone/menaquinone biosynthesis C-methylase UbiE